VLKPIHLGCLGCQLLSTRGVLDRELHIEIGHANSLDVKTKLIIRFKCSFVKWQFHLKPNIH